MSELVVIGFNDVFKAEEVRLKLIKLQRQDLIDLEDAVVAVKRQDGDIQLYQSLRLTSTGATRGGFWGLLVGTMFLSPLLGAAVGVATGAVGQALENVGIDEEFMRELAGTLQPGSSVLFVLVRNVHPDVLVEELSRYNGRLLRNTLSKEDATALQEALEKSRPNPQP